MKARLTLLVLLLPALAQATIIYSNNYANLGAAVTDCNSGATLLIRENNFAGGGNVTTGAACELNFDGTAMLTIGNGETVTINGMLSAGRHKIFDATGTGKVVLGKLVPVAYPEWWGAVGNGSTNDAAAINAGALALNTNKGTLSFSNRVYEVDSRINAYQDVSYVCAGGPCELKGKATGTGYVLMGNATGSTCTGGSGDATTCDDALAGGTRGPGCTCYGNSDCQGNVCTQGTSIYHVNVKGLTFTCKTPGCVALDVGGWKDSTVEGNSFVGYPGVTPITGVLVPGGMTGYTVKFIGNNFSNFRGTTACVGTSGGSGAGADGATCTTDADCTGHCLVSAADDCLAFYQPNSGANVGSGYAFIGNHFYGHCGRAIHVPAKLASSKYGAVQFIGNTIEGWDNLAVDDAALANVYVGNRFEALGTSPGSEYPMQCWSDQSVAHTGACNSAAGGSGRGDKCNCAADNDCESGACAQRSRWLSGPSSTNTAWATIMLGNDDTAAQPIQNNALDAMIVEGKTATGQSIPVTLPQALGAVAPLPQPTLAATNDLLGTQRWCTDCAHNPARTPCVQKTPPGQGAFAYRVDDPNGTAIWTCPN